MGEGLKVTRLEIRSTSVYGMTILFFQNKQFFLYNNYNNYIINNKSDKSKF
jgi:hypothetical protein